MKKLLTPLLLILLAQFSFTSSAQSCLDEIANILIPESPARMDEEAPEYIEFMENTYCFLGENVDSIDLEIATSNAILSMLVMLENMMSEVPITYGRFNEVIIEFTQKEEYPEIRRLHLLNKAFSTKEAIYANWETDKNMLIDLKIEGEKLESFRKYLEAHPNTGKTYEDVMIDYHFEQVMKEN